MLRPLVVFMTVLTLISGAAQTAAQEEVVCPAGDAALVATPSAAMIAALEGSPSASPPTEPHGSPTTTATASPTASPPTQPDGSPTTTATASPPPAETCLVEIGVFVYMPPVIKIPAGTSVIWANRHNRDHTATADDFSWDTGLLSPTDTSDPIVFDTTDTIPYHCEEHPFMVGMIEVE